MQIPGGWQSCGMSNQGNETFWDSLRNGQRAGVTQARDCGISQRASVDFAVSEYEIKAREEVQR